MRKGKNRYIVEVNEWGCGLMIKDTQTGNEIDAPEDEVITLCIKEMNSLAKELDAVRTVTEDNKMECEATRIENARLKAECQARQAENSVLAVECDSLKAEVERLTKAGDAMYQVLAFRRSDPELTSMVGEQWHKAKECKPTSSEVNNMFGVVAPYVVPPCIDKYAAKEGKPRA